MEQQNGTAATAIQPEKITTGVSKKDGITKKVIQEEKSKETKYLNELNKSLNALTPDAKAALLLGKCTELLKENIRNETVLRQTDKKMEVLHKEKEYYQQELSKTVLGKTKLESLCRELQKCNKSIKEESLARIHEEEEKRKETQTKFQKSLNEITNMMNDNNEKNKQLRDDNIELSKKFHHILEQYEIREKQVEKINKQLDLGNQLNETRMAKLQMEKTVEKEIMLREKADLLTELESSKKLIVELTTKERGLREQLNLYTEKYADFQTSMQKSNSIFTGYKTEIDKMSKGMKKMEKDSQSWRVKYEKSHAALLDLISDKQIRDEHIAKTAKQLFYLQKLCRALQSERSVILQTLKDHNIECPRVEPLPVAEPEPEGPSIAQQEVDARKNEKIEKMERNCSDLKQNLLQLQNQLSAIASKEVTESESQPAAQKTNKKNNKAKERKNKNAKKNAAIATVVEGNTEDQISTEVEEETIEVDTTVEILETSKEAESSETVQPQQVANENIIETPEAEIENDVADPILDAPNVEVVQSEPNPEQ